MMEIRPGLVGALAIAAALTTLAPAHAAQNKKHHHATHAPKKSESTDSKATTTTGVLGKSGAWTAYASNDKTGRVCYLIGEPRKSEPAGAGRKSPMAMVTHRPAEKIANVVSFIEGYPLKDGSDVTLQVGSGKFDMFTKGDSAWARTAELDKTVVEALARGHDAVVKGLPQKGRPTIDTYSLAGFAKALALIDKACGVKR